MRDFFQKVKTGNIFQRFIGVGEMGSDIPQGGSPKEGVHNSVNQDIRVRVAGQAFFPGDRHPSQEKGASPVG